MYGSVLTASLVGFVCGFLLLSAASRLLKSFGWETGFTLSTMFHIPKLPKQRNTAKYKKMIKLWQKFFMYSLGYGLIFSGIFAFLFFKLDTAAAFWVSAMLLAVALAGLIDLKIWILPDFLTIPLIISGLAVTYYFAPLTNMENSILGCAYGYIMPLIVTLIMQRYHENPLGGGDVKIMAALGAWVGFEWFNVMLVLSFPAFAVFALVRKSKVCPYGPPLTVAATATVILLLIMQ